MTHERLLETLRGRVTSENEKKRQQNIARAAGIPRQERKMEIEKTLATTKISMGEFDKRLDGEKNIHGVKRKVRVQWKTFILKKYSFKLSQFDPTEVSVEQEKNASLSLFCKIGQWSQENGEGASSWRNGAKYSQSRQICQ